MGHCGAWHGKGLRGTGPGMGTVAKVLPIAILQGLALEFGSAPSTPTPFTAQSACRLPPICQSCLGPPLGYPSNRRRLSPHLLSGVVLQEECCSQRAHTVQRSATFSTLINT